MPKKLTKEIVNERLAPRGIQLIGEYKGAKVKALFKGPCGHEWTADAGSVTGGRGCPTCAGQGRTIDSINREIEGRGIRLIESFEKTSDKVRFSCANGHDWRMRISDVLNKNYGCPHCSRRAKKSAEETNADLKAKGFEIVGPYVNTHTKTKMRGLTCGHVFDKSANALLAGKGCPVCSGYYQTRDTINAELADRKIILVGEFTKVLDKTTFKHLVCGKTWKAKPSCVKSGDGCPHCSGRIVTKEDINAALAPRGIVMLGEYKGVRTKTLFTAPCGHTWEAHPGNVKNSGQGCPHCAPLGVMGSPTGYVYAMTYSNGTTKIGITNEPARRVKQLQKETREHIELIALYQFGEGTGRDAWEAEQKAHRHFADRHAGLSGFDGATELFRITPAEACEYLRNAGGRVAKTATV